MSQSDFVAKGQTLVNSGQYQEAVKVCRLGLLGRPTTVEGRVVLGQALLALKRYDEVLAEMRVALELDHHSFTAQRLKAEALLLKGDPHAAIEVLRKLHQQVPGSVDDLLAECEIKLGRPAISASHPSVNYVGKGSGHGPVDDNTRNYPNHAFGDADEETTGGSFDQPTAIAGPSSKKKSGEKVSVQPRDSQRPTSEHLPSTQHRGPARGRPEVTPSPKVLAVGDKSGTVEVDPELEGIELEEQDDFGDIAAPPRGRQQKAALERGQVSSSRRAGALPTPGLERAPVKKKQRGEISSVELVDDDLVEVDDSLSGEDSLGSSETLQPVDMRRVGGTRVRNAVNFPSGPLDISNSNPAANRPTAVAAVVAPPPHLAQLIANAPHVLEVARPQPSSTRGPHGPIAAALPTMAAVQPPSPYGTPPASYGNAPLPGMPVATPAAARPTLAINAATVDPAHQPWAQRTVAAQPNPVYEQPPPHGRSQHAEDPTQRPQPIDPQLAAMLDAVSMPLEPSQSSARVLKTGMRKGRSKLQVAIWLIIGALVIAGGVIVGFKFRTMRLDKKIADSQTIANGLAKADTWKAMVRSRDRIAGIAQASPTPDNMAALARIRALIAFEFGEGVPEAKTAVDGLGGQGGLDAEIAAAYYALAVNDPKNALEAAKRALKLAADDPAALYVLGQAELLAGDVAAAVKQLQAAVEKEGRPLYRVALSRAYFESSDWKEATRAIEQAPLKAWYEGLEADTARELKDSGIQLSSLIDEHPSVVVQRTRLAVATGQAGGTKATELRTQLEKIIAEGGKSINDQPRGVSLVQVGFTYLALAELDGATGKTANPAVDAALKLEIDDQRFAEQVTETLYSTLIFARATSAAERTLKGWPGSRRARLTLAQLALQQGHPQDALDWLVKIENGDKLAVPLSVRGRAKLALGDLAGAKEDLDHAIEKSNKKLEQALVARTWVDLVGGEVDAARSRIRSRFQGMPTPAVATVWAAILRASGSPDDIKQAKDVLEPVASGAPSVDLARAQLELARLYREAGDEAAKALYTKLIAQTNSREIRMETAKYLIDFSDDTGGREMFDELLKGNVADPPDLLVEAARAHLLVGDHVGGAELLDRADKTSTKSWKYDRERGRLSLRKGDFNGAALQLTKALEKSGDDIETLFLLAEVSSFDLEKFKDLGIKLRATVKARLQEGPLAQLVIGKLTVQNKDDKGQEGAKAFKAANEAMAKAAPPRLRAQAALGVAIVAYNIPDDPVALDSLAVAISLDPTLYEAYIYVADILIGKKDYQKALEKAQLAIKYNPDSVDGYLMMGRVASETRNRKLYGDMLTKINSIAPNSDQLKALQSLRF